MPALYLFGFILLWSMFGSGCAHVPTQKALTPAEITDAFRRVQVLEKHGEHEAAAALRLDVTKRTMHN